MTYQQATNEAKRRSRIRVTRDGACEEMHVYQDLGGDWSCSRWIDIPMQLRTRAIDTYHKGEFTGRRVYADSV